MGTTPFNHVRTVKLDDETNAALDETIAFERTTASDVIRRAIRFMCGAFLPGAPPELPRTAFPGLPTYPTLADLAAATPAVEVIENCLGVIRENGSAHAAPYLAACADHLRDASAALGQAAELLERDDLSAAQLTGYLAQAQESYQAAVGDLPKLAAVALVTAPAKVPTISREAA